MTYGKGRESAKRQDAPNASRAAQRRDAHIPMRTCVSCRSTFPKDRMARFYSLEGGEARFDTSGRKPGRGAYVCSEKCFDKAIRERRIERALGHVVARKDLKVARAAMQAKSS